MMLNDKDLRELAESYDLVTPFTPENCEGATIDITLSHKIKRYIADKTIIPGEELSEEDYEEIDILNDEFFLNPGESVIIQCKEYFKIPDDMAAQILERYSLKLLGLQISPGSYMNPGYQGTMSFIAHNQSPKQIALVAGIKFAQLALFQLTGKAEKPYVKQDAKYLGEKGVSISKMHLDKEIQEFLSFKGVGNVSAGVIKELGGYLTNKLDSSAQKIADELRSKFGDPNEQ